MNLVIFAISWISLGIALCMAQYFLFGIALATSVVVLVISGGLALVLARRIPAESAPAPVVSSSEGGAVAWYLKALVAAIVLAPVWVLRTDAAMVTPWWYGSLLTGVVCAMYGLGTWYLLMRGNQESRMLLALHGLVTFGLAQFVFVHGYGFDPVVHEAALREVVAHGQVLPLQFLYSSYYAALAGVHFVTTIPIALLSTWIVPVAAAMMQAWVAPWAFEVLWGMQALTARRAAVLLSVVSVPIFVLSTPWSAGVLLTVVLLLLAPLAARRTIPVLVFFGVLVLAIGLLHPLIGIPVALSGAIALWRVRGRVSVVSSVFMIVVALVGLFGWMRMRSGVPFFEQANSWVSGAQFVMNTYGVRLGFLVAGIYILMKSRSFVPEMYRRVVSGLVAGVGISAVLLWMFVPAPNVAAIDQYEYAWRLLLVALVVIAPAIAVAAARYTARTQSAALVVVLVVAMTLSWYAMYPSADSTVRVVSGADIRSAQWITTGTVLCDQVFAQAGLKVHGFPSRFPVDATGDSAIRSEVLLHQSVAEAIAGIEGPVFVVVHLYWYRAAQIDLEARAAGLELVREDAQVRVYSTPMDMSTLVR